MGQVALTRGWMPSVPPVGMDCVSSHVFRDIHSYLISGMGTRALVCTALISGPFGLD